MTFRPLNADTTPKIRGAFAGQSRGFEEKSISPGNLAGKAFSLVEVTIALGVAAFCLLAIIGLLQTGLTSEKATTGQTAAASVLSTVFSDLASTPTTESSTRIFKLLLTNQSSITPQTVFFSEAGERTGAVGAEPTTESRYRVSVGLQSPTNSNKAPTPVRILVTWPAAADTLPNQWPSKAAGSLEVATALDRN